MLPGGFRGVPGPGDYFIGVSLAEYRKGGDYLGKVSERSKIGVRALRQRGCCGCVWLLGKRNMVL